MSTNQAAREAQATALRAEGFSEAAIREATGPTTPPAGESPQQTTNRAAREAQAAALRAEGLSEAAISEATGRTPPPAGESPEARTNRAAREAQAAALRREGKLTEEEISQATGLPTPPVISEAEPVISEVTPPTDEFDRDDAFKQVIDALERGVTISPDLLERLNVPQSEIDRIVRKQTALRAVRAVPGVAVDGNFRLGLAIQSGVSLATLAEAGFRPEDITRANDSVAARSAGAKREDRREPPRAAFLKIEKRLDQARTQAFEAATKSARVDRRFDRAAAALSEFLVFDADGTTITGIRVTEALEAGKRPQDLIDIGVSQTQIAAIFMPASQPLSAPAQALAVIQALGREVSAESGVNLEFVKFIDDEGRIDTVRALRAGLDPEVLRNLGQTAAQVKASQDLDQQLSALEKVDIDRSSTQLSRINDTLKELFTFGRVETAEFNEKDIESKYFKAQTLLSREYDSVDAEATAKGERILQSKNDFILANIGTRGAYVTTVLASQPALSSVAKEFGLASIPIYGTIRTWDEAPNWARAVGVASDLLLFVPVVGQISAATRAGTTLGTAAGRITLATAKGPLVAIRHPLLTAKATLEPIETLLRPTKLPLNALEVRHATIRLPVIEGFRVTPGDIKIPSSAMQGLDVESGLISKAGRVKPEIRLADIEGLPNADAIRASMEWRDAVTLKAIQGGAAKGSLPFGEGALLTPSLQKIVGPAAVHGSPDIRPFLLGTTVGKTGPSELFVAPGVMSRFIRLNATGKIPELSPKIQEAIALGQISKEPLPGAILIRDPEILKRLSTSNKLWQGTAEIERTLPTGTILPPPSQLLFTRIEGGQKVVIAIIGKPLTKAELLKFKLLAPTDTIRSIFSRPGRITGPNRVTTAIDEADVTVDLLNRAAAAESRGATAEAQNLRLRAAASSKRAEDALNLAQRTAADDLSSGAVRPVSIYTGNQDIIGALRLLRGGRAKAVSRADREARATGGTFRVSETATRQLGAFQLASAGASVAGLDRSVVEVRRPTVAAVTAPVRVAAAPRPAVVETAVRRPTDLATRTARAQEVQRQAIAGFLPAGLAAAAPERITTERVKAERTAITAAPPPGRLDIPAPPPPGRLDIPAPPPPGRLDIPAPPPPGRLDIPAPPPPGRLDIPAPPPPGRLDIPTPPPPGRFDGPPPPPPGRVPPGRPVIMLPDGRPLPPGTFPRVIEWGQGENKGIINLVTGDVRFVDRDPDGRTPFQTFIAVDLMTTRPPNRTFRMGFEDVSITGRDISFKRNRLADGRKRKSGGTTLKRRTNGLRNRGGF